MFASTIIPVILTALVSGVVAQNGTDVLTTGQLGNATVVENNPLGQTYVATLPATSFFNPTDPLGNIKGSVSAVANPNGIGVQFKVSFSNFPTSGGPFSMYLPLNYLLLLMRYQSTTSTMHQFQPMVTAQIPWHISILLFAAR